MRGKGLHRPPKGTRTPGSGRKKGVPNKISVEARTLVSQLVNNETYQHKLRRDFMARRVHPTIESLIWTYHLGKPTQPIEISGGLDVKARLDEERRVFASLDIHDLEQLAAESQALVNRAFALANIAQNRPQDPQDVVVEGNRDSDPSESLGNMGESNNSNYVAQKSDPEKN